MKVYLDQFRRDDWKFPRCDCQCTPSFSRPYGTFQGRMLTQDSVLGYVQPSLRDSKAFSARLKPNSYTAVMYGLKAIPFRDEFLRSYVCRTL
jgi:hypothetical protein